MVSTHEEIRNGLRDLGLKYALVIPDRSLNDQWLSRLQASGNHHLVPLFKDNWDKFIQDCTNQKGCEIHTLGSSQYLTTVMEGIKRQHWTKLDCFIVDSNGRWLSYLRILRQKKL